MGEHSGNPFEGKELRVLAFISSQSCQSGLMVALRSDRLNKNVTLDSHWLHFVSRPNPPANGEWDDDIPFSNAAYSMRNGRRLLIPEQFKEDIYFEKD